MKSENSHKELTVTRFDKIRNRFLNDIVVLPSAHAEKIIRAHPKCPFEEFEFIGECYLNRWYYIAGDGKLQLPNTQIILLEK